MSSTINPINENTQMTQAAKLLRLTYLALLMVALVLPS